MPQTGPEATITHKPVAKCLEKKFEAGYKCVWLNARSLVNKKNELNIMVEDINPHIIGITELWANKDISGLTGYVMFIYIRTDRIRNV